MVIKQVEKTCYCGLPMIFPDGEIRTRCFCGAVWTLGEEGYWYTSGPVITPDTTKAKPSRCERYMNRRNQSKRRKAGHK